MLILLIEDDVDYADIVAELLRRDAYEVVIATSVDGGRRFVRDNAPAAAIVDVTHPDGAGLELVSELRRERPGFPILVLSNRGSARDIVEGFRAGADDYLTKPFHPAEFLARVRAVLRRHEAATVAQQETTPWSQSASREDQVAAAELRFDDVDRAVYFRGAKVSCTPLEFEILRELARVPGQVLSHSYLNERVWEYSHLNDGTLLKGHISSLRRKLRAVGGDERAIRTVHGVGYAFAATS